MMIRARHIAAALVWTPALLLVACGGGGSGGDAATAPLTPTSPAPTPALDTAGFLEFVAGTAPLVIVAPHGGALKPVAIPDRTCAGCEFLADANTVDLARAVVDAFARRTGKRPYLAVNHLHRIKFDGNRELAEATDNHTMLNGVWNSWQDNLDSASARASRTHGGRGLYIELHGHAHAVPRIEIGYLLTAAQLRSSDAVLSAGLAMRQSSIARLVLDNRSGSTDVALLRGTQSLGALLFGAGYAAVPSPSDPAPATADAYFSGGYNTVRHGSLSGGPTDAIQLECNFAGVRDTAENRAAFAEALAAALAQFLKAQYGWPTVAVEHVP
jgi:N-formylglutamate amidohydrolase